MGSALSAYVVSPSVNAPSRGPKPIANVYTAIPTRLATSRWPSSWTRIMSSNARIASTSVDTQTPPTAGDPLFIDSSPFMGDSGRGPPSQRIVAHGHGKQEAVEPVQESPVPGEETAGIL